MARLSKIVVEQRETFIKEFFKKNPNGTAAKAQEELKASGIPGGAMRPGRVYELKREVKATPEQSQAAPAPAAGEFVADPIIAIPLNLVVPVPTPAVALDLSAPTVVLNPLTGEPIEPVKA